MCFILISYQRHWTKPFETDQTMHALQAVMVTAGVSMASAANTCKTVHIGTFQSIVCPPDPNGPHRTKCLLALPGES